jgi:hypothetical protein
MRMKGESAQVWKKFYNCLIKIRESVALELISVIDLNDDWATGPLIKDSDTYTRIWRL